MGNKWLRLLIAWALATAMLPGACGLAEAVEDADAAVLSEAVEASVAEVGEIDLYDLSVYAEEIAPEAEALMPETDAVVAAEESTQGNVDALEAAETVGEVEAGEESAPESAEATEGTAEDEIAAQAEDAEAQDDAEAEALAAAEAKPLSLDAEALTLGVKETRVLTPVFAEDAPAGEVAFVSSDEGVASVGATTGKVTAKKAGDAVITATCGELTASCAVTVVKAPGKVKMSLSKASLGVGETLRLVATLPEGTASKLTWKSNKASVASVDGDGVVTARAKGTATITAKTFNGKKTTCKVTVKTAPTTFRLSESALTLSVGQARTLSAQLSAGSAGGFALTSGAEGIVAAEGNAVTAVAAGEATVVAETYNGLTSEARITVVEAPTEMSLGDAAIALGVGEKRALSPTFDRDAPVDLTYMSSDAKVASVSGAGVITAKKKGVATVTAATHNGLTASVQVTVVKAPTKVTLSQTKLTMGVDETAQLTAKVPDGCASAIAFSSSKKGVATVDTDGVVTAVGKGTATITAKAFNGKKATCKVTVKAEPEGVTLVLDATEAGVGQAFAAKATPNSGSAGAIGITSANTDVAVVEGTTVTPVAVGETDIVATAYNGVCARVRLRVLPAPTAMSVNAEAVMLGVGEKFTVLPEIDAGSAAGISYTSSKKSVATVSAGGVITGKKVGSATVTVATHNGLERSIDVKVKKAPAKVTLSPSKLTLELNDLYALSPKLPSGTSSELKFSSSDESVAFVGDDGVLSARGIGVATVTVRTFNGKKATCKVTVVAYVTAPDAPAATAEPSGPNAIRLSWTPARRAVGYRVYVGTTPDAASAELYGSYGAETVSTTLRGLSADCDYYIYIAAYNQHGESGRSMVSARTGAAAGEDAANVSLDYAGLIMMKLGADRMLTARTDPAGREDALEWETTSESIALIIPDGAECEVFAVDAGVATVSAELPEGTSASVTVMVVDTSNLTSSNFTAVQKAILRHEELMNEDEGGDVVWEMIASKLERSNIQETRAKEIVSRVKEAEDTYRSIYVYSFGSYDIRGEAVTDRSGNVVTTSYYYSSDNTVYLQRKTSSTTAEAYDFVLLHETGHAIDYNADGNKKFSSQNEKAVAAVVKDVRDLLSARIDAAASSAGVDMESIRADRVIDAVMNYRELLHHAEVMRTMTEDEQAVYEKLLDRLGSELNNNRSLPTNNGTMVWDAIEGATNYAVNLRFGHRKYLEETELYGTQFYYYFYDRAGNPKFTSEPWAEFFASKLMQDEKTTQANETYLPETVKYFGEVLAPQILNYYKEWVAGK